MSKIKLVAIDLAKRCYQMGAIDEHHKVLYNRKLSPAKFAVAIQQLEPTIIAMEACSAAHYWGRRLIALGHDPARLAGSAGGFGGLEVWRVGHPPIRDCETHRALSDTRLSSGARPSGHAAIRRQQTANKRCVSQDVAPSFRVALSACPRCRLLLI